jgi:hypothetical protein
VTLMDALMLAPWALFVVGIVVIFLMLFRSARRRARQAAVRPRERRDARCTDRPGPNQKENRRQ